MYSVIDCIIAEGHDSAKCASEAQEGKAMPKKGKAERISQRFLLP